MPGGRQAPSSPGPLSLAPTSGPAIPVPTTIKPPAIVIPPMTPTNGTSDTKKPEQKAKEPKYDKEATGAHTTFKRDNSGYIYQYQSWQPNTNPNYPKPFVPGPRFDGGLPNGGAGAPHFNKKLGVDVPTPHINDKTIPGGVRPALPSELPRNPRFIVEQN